VKIAYLINTYPAPSLSFIRREILALEAAGHRIVRHTVRRFAGELADAQDREELAKTRVLLDAGVVRIGLAVVACLLTQPAALFRAMQAARSLSRKSTRGVMIHAIYLAEACLLLRWLQDEAVDHLHAHFGTNASAVAMLCRVMGGVKYSFTVHGPEEFEKAPSLGLDIKSRHAALVVAISEYGRSQLRRWVSPADHHKLKIVHCGVDSSFTNGSTADIPDSPTLVFIGRLTAAKGVRVLMEALARLHETGVAFLMTLIGDGPERSALEQFVREKGLQRSVRIAGWQGGEDVRAAIARSRALVLPSLAEGLPVVLMEAFALGRPVISTSVAGIPELVEPGQNGWLVSPGSVEQLTTALVEVLTCSNEQLRRLARHGNAVVRARHDASIEAGKLADLFLRPVPADMSARGERPTCVASGRFE
jgi:glycosyltransferase involved in cell wall biosynthesis